LVALADEHDSMLETGVLAQRGRHEDAAGTIHFHVVGMTDEKALQAAHLLIERGQRHEPRLDRLPDRERIEQQAMTGIGGEDERAARRWIGGFAAWWGRAPRHRVAVLRRDR